MASVFEVLNQVNVNEHTERKNGLTYLAWAWAWAEVKKRYPDANYTVYERTDGVIYWTDGKTCWVKTGVTINGLEHIEYLPVMDVRNRSVPAENITSMDVNKAIQRSLTKAVARHGLGLYIYAGEDLPEEEQKQEDAESQRKEEAGLESMRKLIFSKLSSNPEILRKYEEKYGIGLSNLDTVTAGRILHNMKERGEFAESAT